MKRRSDQLDPYAEPIERLVLATYDRRTLSGANLIAGGIYLAIIATILVDAGGNRDTACTIGLNTVVVGNALLIGWIGWRFLRRAGGTR